MYRKDQTMGYTNYKLKDEEIINNRNEIDRELPIKKELIKYDCFYCKSSFDDKQTLFNHIRLTHHKVGPLLVVNGKIPTEDVDFYVPKIDEVIIQLYDVNTKVIMEKQVFANNASKLDLTENVKAVLTTKSKVTIKLDDRVYRIAEFSMAAIKNPIVYQIIDEWNEQTANMIQPKMVKDSFNHVEMKYLQAFYNYYVATQSNQFDKNNRYLDTFNVLRYFSTIDSLTSTVMKVILYKLNWIDYLKQQNNQNDDFRMIIDFYDFMPHICDDKEIETGKLFVEDYLEDYIRIIKSYYLNEFDIVDEYLNLMEKDNFTDDNYKDRYLFLKFRRQIDQGKIENAYKIYIEIQNPYLKGTSEHQLKVIQRRNKINE